MPGLEVGVCWRLGRVLRGLAWFPIRPPLGWIGDGCGVGCFAQGLMRPGQAQPVEVVFTESLAVGVGLLTCVVRAGGATLEVQIVDKTVGAVPGKGWWQPVVVLYRIFQFAEW